MESLPLTAEAIASTEKKMDMTLGMVSNHFFLFNYMNAYFGTHLA
jgi:hypothetical protein